MKFLLTICALCLYLPVFSQRLPQITDPRVLSAMLTDSADSEKEKVSKIFHWITDNIAYRVIPGVKKRGKPVSVVAEGVGDEDEVWLPSLTDRVATKVLKDRKAVCDGYARLFKSLCDYAGLESAIITGYARADQGSSPGRFRSNHSWNAVRIDSVWHLLDVTWASGYLEWTSGDFVRHYDGYYYLTPPDQFIRHHYPDNLRWTLLNETPAMPEFKRAPFRQRSFYKYSITGFSPDNGIIEAYMGDTIRLEIETGLLPGHNPILPDSLWDSTSLVYSPAYAYLNPSIDQVNHKVHYQFRVESENIQWLHLMYNSDAVLRYRINVRKKEGL
jgi:hypothetical protein